MTPSQRFPDTVRYLGAMAAREVTASSGSLDSVAAEEVALLLLEVLPGWTEAVSPSGETCENELTIDQQLREQPGSAERW